MIILFSRLSTTSCVFDVQPSSIITWLYSGKRISHSSPLIALLKLFWLNLTTKETREKKSVKQFERMRLVSDGMTTFENLWTILIETLNYAVISWRTTPTNLRHILDICEFAVLGWYRCVIANPFASIKNEFSENCKTFYYFFWEWVCWHRRQRSKRSSNANWTNRQKFNLNETRTRCSFCWRPKYHKSEWTKHATRQSLVAV